MKTTAKRKSNIELLRIVAMFMIISSHFSLYTNWNLNNEPISENIKVMMFSPFGTAGAVIFFMITGFFSIRINKPTITIKQLLKKEYRKIGNVWAESLTYSIGSTCVIYVLGYSISKSQILTSVLLFTRNEYWFISAYVFLCLLSPFLSTLVKQLNLPDYLRLLGILALLLILAAFGNVLITNLLLAITGYLVGGFFKLYPTYTTRISGKCVLIFNIGVYLIGEISIFLLSYAGIPHGHQGHFTSGAFSVIFAAGVFLMFLNLQIKFSRIINFVASTVFSAYLITENVVVRGVLWNDTFDIGVVQHSILFPFLGILIVIIIICGAIIIDTVRKVLLIMIKLSLNKTFSDSRFTFQKNK